MNVKSLIPKILKGNKLAAAKMITLLENRNAKARQELKSLYPHTGKAYRIGITGPQGVGKSSLINHLLEAALKQKKKVGVLAIDPTSAQTGGAFLGDRIRMQHHTLNKNVFIRSMATRSCRGGLSHALRDAVNVLDAMGTDLIFIETIGVGQDEIEITEAADITLLVLSPDFGDKFQALKAGLFEMCDLVVLNKTDLPHAKLALATLQDLVPLPAFSISSRKGTGIPKLYLHLMQFWSQACQNGRAKLKREDQFKAEVREKIEEALLLNLEKVWSSKQVQTLIQQAINKNKKNPNHIVSKILKKLK